LPCENIRIEIYHIKDEVTGQIKADPHVKAVYAAKRFRWKTLTNDPSTGKRAQIMQLNNADKITRNEPFQIKVALVLETGASNTESQPKINNCQIVAPINKLSLGLDEILVDVGELVATKVMS